MCSHSKSACEFELALFRTHSNTRRTHTRTHSRLRLHIAASAKVTTAQHRQCAWTRQQKPHLVLSDCSSTHELFEFIFFFPFIPRVFNECTRLTVCSPLPWQSGNYVYVCVSVCVSSSMSVLLLARTRSYNWRRWRCALHEFFIDAQIFELCPSSQSETLALRARIRGYIYRNKNRNRNKNWNRNRTKSRFRKTFDRG